MQAIRAAAAHALGRRPAVLLVLSFEAGLATGLSHFPAPAFVALLLAALCLVTGRGAMAWLPCASGIGLVLGLVTREASSRECAAVLPAGVIEITLELLEPVQSGVAAAAQKVCDGEIAVKVRGDRVLPAGSRWRVTGRWIPTSRLGGRPGGILVAQELSPIPNSQLPTPSTQLRNWLSRTTTRLYGTRAGLVDALLVGRRGGIDPALNAAFARSGLVHLLSISGFHVGVIFGWAVFLLRALRVSRESSAALAASLVVLYVSFLGWPAPAGRAALLCVVVAWSIARQRHPAAGSLLALTCLIATLLDPWALFDLGGWLSVSALLGAITFSRWSQRALGPHPGWRMLFASVGATVST
ncbi:MAG: ComEC/Rec2 family competence protein, partial [Chloroflexota bacterium]|nr:ComEC/Rec2 family competence protein [Chloroflexota bacterium]